MLTHLCCSLAHQSNTLSIGFMAIFKFSMRLHFQYGLHIARGVCSPVAFPRQYHRSSLETKHSTRSIVLRLLGDVRSEQEARQYFSGLSLDPAKECILIKVGSSIISRHLDSLVSALALLSRIRIYPIVVHEAVSPIDTIAQVTDASMLALTRSVLLGANLELVEALENSETRARPITSGVFEAEYLDKRQYGLVGKIKAVDLRAIKRSIAEYCIPVLVLMGETPDGQILEVNGIRELANSLQPRKIILLSEDGGVFSMDKNERISVIKIEESHAQQIHDSDREKIREYEELLNNQPGTSEIRILRPVDLVRGLFVDEVVGTTIIKSKTSTFE